MRGIVALIALIACGATAASTLAGGSRTASLRLVDRDPLTVQGYGFKARERVRVTASMPESPRMRLPVPASPRRVVRTSATGSFRAVFSEISIDRCNMVRVVAIGVGDRRVVLKVLPSPLCPPLLSPPSL